MDCNRWSASYSENLDNIMRKPPDLDLSAENKAILAELLDAHGYDGLKETQAFAFERGIMDDGNDILVAETGNGKTLTAEAIVKKHLDCGDRVAYLVPSTQLVWAKKDALQEWAGTDYRIYTGRGKYRSADVAVATFDSFYQAILTGAEGARELDAIILDDFHELYSGFRGRGIELAISAAMYEGSQRSGSGGSESSTRLYGVSATLGNPEELGRWMNADIHISPEDRQVPIKEFTVDTSSNSKKQAIIDVMEENPEKGPFLVFCYAKSWVESRASAIADAGLFDGPPRPELRSELADRIDGMLTSTHHDILDMLEAGVGYIHADLPGKIKQYVLELYEAGKIDAITTTTSLAYGFDSPVQSVIVADMKRRGEWVGCYEFIQWEGRAARPRFSYPCGYCFALTNDPEEAAERFFMPDRNLEDVKTHIDDEGAFRWTVLELIANGWSAVEDLEGFFEHTLYWEQMNTESAWGQQPRPRSERLRDRLEKTADWLEAQGFIEESETWGGFNTTNLGQGAVDFKFNSFVDASLTSIKAFYDWAEETDIDDITQLDYLHQTIANFDLSLTVKTVDGPLGPALTNRGFSLTDEGITAGVLRWYWMGNYSTERIEQEAGVDPTYIPGIASKVSRTIEATQYILEAAPNARVPEWHDSLVTRCDRGVREDAVPFVADISALGRARIRFLRSYIEQMARQTLEIDADKDLWTLLTAFREHCGSDDQFETIIADQVAMVGSVTAASLTDFLEENNLSPSTVATEEEDALSGRRVSASNSASVADYDPENTRPTSLRDY